MKRLNICIDIDGTITEAYYWLDITNKYFNKNITEEMVTEYYIPKVVGIEDEAYFEFYEKNKIKIHTEQKLRDDVKRVLEKLNILHNIYFITAREKTLTMLTHSYLENHNIAYNELFVLGSHYKVDKAKELHCDIFIEDSYENAAELAEAGVKVFLLDTNYNRKPLHENITRVYSWKEIYSLIKELLLQEEAV